MIEFFQPVLWQRQSFDRSSVVLNRCGSAVKSKVRAVPPQHLTSSCEANSTQSFSNFSTPRSPPFTIRRSIEMTTFIIRAFALAALLAASSRAQSLDEYRRFALSQQADVERGKALFFNEAKLACSKCHTIDGKSGKAGPDLYAIGDKYPRPALIEAILQPSANIAIGYTTTIVITQNGDEYSGILQSANNEAVELMGADGKLIRIPRRDIKEQKASPISLMPEGVQSGLTLQEFNDLIEFLISLRQPETALVSDTATPAIIPKLAKPIKVTPLFQEKFTTPRIDGVESGLTGFWPIPGQKNAALVTHQVGLIWLIEKTKTAEKKSLFADQISETYSKTGPNGLLGLAFHPKFTKNRKYYLKYQVFEDQSIATVLVEKKMAPDFRHDSGEPARRLIKIPSLGGDHGGGCVQFGPDGYLYFAMGDSGPHRDPNGNAQNMQLLLGKMVRIDVDHHDEGRAYSIPRDNPFVGQSAVRPEIWACGFRNPWRFSFDSRTGELWLADVGQDRVEEIDIVHRGQNYGWNVYEGFERFSDTYREDGVKYTPPLMAYKRKYGNSITGGDVYRGRANPSFNGVYIFGDYNSKLIFGLKQKHGKLDTVRQIGTAPERIVSFSADEQGELYLAGFEGTIFKLDFPDTAFNAPIKND
jgi:putative heme-binding domain-containing protein